MSRTHVHFSVYTMLFLVLFLLLRFCDALMFIFLFWEHAGYKNIGLYVCSIVTSPFFDLCRFCLQQWGLDVNLWSTAYGLDNSLGFRRILIEPLWSGSIIWFYPWSVSYLVSGDHPGSVEYEFHLMECHLHEQNFYVNIFFTMDSISASRHYNFTF